MNELVLAAHASHDISGITDAHLLISTGEINEVASELLADEVIAPWVTKPRRARQGLLVALGEVDPQIPELLEAAWAQVESIGPAEVVVVSNAAVEALDRTLRALAPNDAVPAEHDAVRLHRDSVCMKDGAIPPTRARRVAYTVQRCHSGETRRVIGQTKTLTISVGTFQDSFQAGKHGSTGTVGLVCKRQL